MIIKIDHHQLSSIWRIDLKCWKKPVDYANPEVPYNNAGTVADKPCFHNDRIVVSVFVVLLLPLFT